MVIALVHDESQRHEETSGNATPIAGPIPAAARLGIAARLDSRKFDPIRLSPETGTGEVPPI
jgi:hypothetical protein